jgi:predicted GH43/DUF377 family glycosyl hydrolase
MIAINRSTTVLKADSRRVILLFNTLGIGTYETQNRSVELINRVMNLTEEDVESSFNDVMLEFGNRHRYFKPTLLKYFEKIEHYIPSDLEISEKRKLLLGAHFTKEYSIQAAALFNPSIVPHPDQENLKDGEKRFIISLRSVGEGHISSIEFREGIISSAGEVTLDTITPFSSCSEKDISTIYNKVQLKERTANISNFDNNIFDSLSSTFTYQDYKVADEAKTFESYDINTQKILFDIINTNYNVKADMAAPLSERVIFPSTKEESMGMEDVRFVEFTHENGRKEYIGTYTAYDGHKIIPKLIITEDFINFQIRTMFGKAVSDKGFALFPEKINGKYVMTARQGGEDLTIMESDDLYIWNEYEVIMSPQYEWGLVQQGNCGAPIKTEKGWLLLTHAVGPLRKYVISAILLDLDQPKKIIGKLKKPLISPNEDEREGYVPNVVYSCGALKHNDNLVIPYAMSDSASSFATVSVTEILKNMTNENYN